MVGLYARQRLRDQFKAVAFIVLYLVAFQLLVLGTAPAGALRIAGGIGMVVIGLTLFLEGLLLGLMPLGERVGLRLPQRGGLAVIIGFGLLLGIGSTLAEPAIAALRATGASLKAWEAPLLFHILENESGKLVVAIGVGVGIAVAVGMVRLFFGLSIKPFVYVLVPLLLLVSGYCAMDRNLISLLGLAWDAGAVTTGAVTVPLVLALGMGVSRAIGRQDGGFGIIMLASAFPILGVLVLGMLLASAVPPPMAEADFFAPGNRAEAMRIFPSEAALLRHARRRGGADAREALRLGAENAPPAGTGALPESDPLEVTSWPDVLRQESGSALRSVVPLTALLLAALVLLIRERLPHNDEVMLGIALSLVGMAILTSGIRTGLVPLGDEVGISLPRVFSSEMHEEMRVLIEPFDLAHVQVVYAADGTSERFFYHRGPSGRMRLEAFEPEQFDPGTGRYEHIVRRRPLFHANLTFAGIGLVFLFAFGLGFGSTLAEPALRALGAKVEDISVGTIRGKGVVHAVSIGVGLGLMVGVARILYNIPTLWLIIPPYVLLLWLTWTSEEDFAGIAWDCGGVTTGVVTVPLVMAMGLGIGGELNVADGFGSLAMASVYPIITVLLYGLVVRARQRRSIRATDKETGNA